MAFLPGWSKFIEGTISAVNIPSALSGFPVAVKISTASGLTSQDISAVFDELGSSWQKVAFQLGESASESYAELEYWDNANEKAVFNVKFELASGENKFRMYFDNTHADNTAYIGAVTTAPAQAVWDTSTKRRYGLAQDPTGGAGCIKDSTSNAGHGTPSGTWAAGDLITADYPYGKGLDFRGAHYISIPDATDLTPTSSGFTVEAVYSLDSLTNSSPVAKTNPYEWALTEFTTNLYWQTMTSDGGTAASASTSVSPLSVTRYVVGTVDTSGYVRLYVNGTLIATSTSGLLPSNTASTMRIGYRYFQTDRYIDGKIYEVRISATTRSAAWILATYKSLTDTLITYSGVQLTQTWGINGVVKAGGSLYPGAKVLLIDRVTQSLVSVATAAETTAEYSFTGLSNGDAGRYATHIIDPTDTYNDAVISAITPYEE